jgi:hypothetical protein
MLVIMTGVGYYFFFFTPTLEKMNAATSAIARKSQEVTEAEIREIQYTVQVTRRDELAEAWEAYIAALPVQFDDADILYRIQDIIYPYTQSLHVSFPNEPGTAATNIHTGEAQTLSAVSIYPVGINFTVGMESLMAVLQGFAHQNIDNIINNCNLSRVENSETGEITYLVSMTVNFIVQKGAQ